jgi:hypothetical protein
VDPTGGHDAEIDRFVFVKLDDTESKLKRQPDFAAFDNWPADAELALLSMSWSFRTGFGLRMFREFARLTPSPTPTLTVTPSPPPPTPTPTSTSAPTPMLTPFDDGLPPPTPTSTPTP